MAVYGPLCCECRAEPDGILSRPMSFKQVLVEVGRRVRIELPVGEVQQRGLDPPR